MQTNKNIKSMTKMSHEDKIQFIKRHFKFECLLAYDNKSTEFKLYKGIFITQIKNLVPDTLYKYRECNDNNFNALANKEAYFSYPSEWEDELDVTVQFNSDKDRNNLNNYIDEIIKNCCNSILEPYKKKTCNENMLEINNELLLVLSSIKEQKSKPNYDKLNLLIMKKFNENEAKNLLEKIEKVYNHLSKFYPYEHFKKFYDLNKDKDKYKMFSVSETYDSPKMWETAADKGKGFCIEYVTNKIFMTDSENEHIFGLFPIIYADKDDILISDYLRRYSLYINNKNLAEKEANELEEKIFLSLFTKDNSYSMEKEWRYCILSNKMENEKKRTIDFDFASAIYLGQNISKENELRLIEIAKQQNLLIYKRKLDDTSSKWIYEEIK